MSEENKIWEDQKKFNKHFINFDGLTDEERVKHTKEYLLHCISEFDEVLRELNWKTHRRPEHSEINKQKLLEELTDVYKYFLSIMVLYDFSPEDLHKEYWRKSSVVEQRYEQEFNLDLADSEKYVAIDIDGVLADYPNSFLKFVSAETGIDLSDFVMTEYKIYDQLSAIIPGGKSVIKDLKHKYRSEGHKRYINVITGASQALSELKGLGYTIVLLTARPYKQYTRMFADTIEWLKNNGMVYDAIIWDDNKEEKIIREFPKIDFMVEDNLENAIKIAEQGYNVYLLDKIYNQGTLPENVKRKNDWYDIIKEVKKNER